MRAFELEDILPRFVEHCSKHLGLEHTPGITITDDALGDREQPTFAYYDHEHDHITVSSRNRHAADVMRSLAHELVHARQSQRGELDHRSGRTGSPQENESNAVAGIIMRDFARLHPEIMG